MTWNFIETDAMLAKKEWLKHATPLEIVRRACKDDDLESLRKVNLTPDLVRRAWRDGTNCGHTLIIEHLDRLGAITRTEYDWALRRAARKGHVQLFSYLMDRIECVQRCWGVNVGACGYVLLQLAIKHGHLGVVEDLLDSADIEERSFGDDFRWDRIVRAIAIRRAAIHGRTRILRFLIDRWGSEFSDVKTCCMNKAIRDAVDHGHRNVVVLLRTLYGAGGGAEVRRRC